MGGRIAWRVGALWLTCALHLCVWLAGARHRPGLAAGAVVGTAFAYSILRAMWAMWAGAGGRAGLAMQRRGA